TDGRPSRIDRGPAADIVDAGGGDRWWEADGRSASGDSGRQVLPSRARRRLGDEGGGVQDLPGGLGHLHGGPLRLLWQPQARLNPTGTILEIGPGVETSPSAPSMRCYKVIKGLKLIERCLLLKFVASQTTDKPFRTGHRRRLELAFWFK
ncbi:hypothetical protein ACJX0J_033011, partial [Zea mays]